MNDWVDVGPASGLAPGGQLSVVAGAARVLLCHDTQSGRVWAVQDRCPHAFQSLAGGVVRGGTLQCPKHGACFDLATGRSLNTVTPRPALVHATKVQQGRIFVSTHPLPAPAR